MSNLIGTIHVLNKYRRKRRDFKYILSLVLIILAVIKQILEILKSLLF